MRWPTAWLSACSCVLALAGCGGSEETAERPALPAPLAEQLAGRADTVAAQLEAGDPCGAAERAVALQQAAIQALNRPGQVPAALKEDLGVAVADLVDRAQSECAATEPPPAATTTAEDEHDEGEDGPGRGKKKGHEKRKGKRN